LLDAVFKVLGSYSTSADIRTTAPVMSGVLSMSSADSRTDASCPTNSLSISVIWIFALNCPVFTGELLAQILSCFFIGIQGFIEVLLCFMWRDVTDFAV
jgi:hypothetical protein